MFYRDYINLIFYCDFPMCKDLAAMPQIWPQCHRFGHSATDLDAVSQIGQRCHRFGQRATDLAAGHRFGRLAIDLAQI